MSTGSIVARARRLAGRATRHVSALALAGTTSSAGCRELPRTYGTAGSAPLFEDDFQRSELGDAWNPSGPGASIAGGRLEVRDVRNHPCWLGVPLPDDVRIEFDAWAHSAEGDIKVELGGDGRSSARSTNYRATGYVVIFGGWNNSRNAIVRIDEHGPGRVVGTEPRVVPDRRYHFVLTKQGGDVRWELDGEEILALRDRAPLTGPDHAHFAFSGWEAPVAFDNLRIEALAP